MAGKNDDLIYDVDIDLSDSLQALEQLKSRLGTMDATLVASVGKLQREMKKAASSYAGYIRDLKTQMNSLAADDPNRAKFQTRIASISAQQQGARRAVVADYAQGTQTDVLQRATVDRDIARLRATTQALQNKLSREVSKQLTDSISYSAEQIAARVNREAAQAADLIKSSTQRHLTNQSQMRDLDRERLDLKANAPDYSTLILKQDQERLDILRQNQAEEARVYRQYQRSLADARRNPRDLKVKDTLERAAMELREVRAGLTDVQTQAALLRQKAEDDKFRAQNGGAAFGFRQQRERRTLNGGADQFMSQAGIMNNYAMVGALYGGSYFLANFITQLDKEFKQFQAITATTTDEMGRMEDRLLSVAEQTKFTALEVAEAAVLMGQAGLSAQNVGAAIEPVTLLATAAGTGLKEAVDLVTSSLNVFNLQTSDAAHLADVYTAALNESKLTLDQLALAMQYSGNIASTAGVSYNELTAAIGAMANAGIRSGSTMGTGMRQLLVDLLNPSENLKERLDALGVSMADIDIEANGLTGVLANLKAAGFSTADAFEGFEVRAAAAFTALSSNIDTISNLRQSFILSNAATEANQTQMESLSNTAAKFTSNIGALAYDGFRPYLAVLQDVVNGMADMMSVMRQSGPALDIVAASIAGIATAWAAVKIGSLVAGLFSVSAGASAASGAVGVLFTMLRAHPIGFAIAALTTAVTLMYDWGNSAVDTAEKIDKIRGRIDTWKGSIDETNGRMKSLDQTIDDLVKKQENLGKAGNESLRQLKVMEVVSTFSELGTEIDTSTASIEDLIAALQNLKGELAADLPATFEAMLADLNLEITTLKQAMDEYQAGAGKQEMESTLLDRFRPEVRAMNREGLTNDQIRPRLGELLQQGYGESAFQAYQATTGGLDLDGQQARAVQSQMAAQVSRLSTELITTSNEARKAEIERDLEVLERIIAAFKPVADNAVTQQARVKERELAAQGAATSRLQATPAYETATGMVTALNTEMTEGQRGIIRDDLGIEASKAAYEKLAETFKERVAAIKTQLNKAAVELRQDGELSEDQIQKALAGSELQGGISDLEAALSLASGGNETAFNELITYLRKKQKANLENDLNGLKQRLGKARNEREIDLIEGQLNDLLDELAKAETEILELDRPKDVGSNDADLELAKRQLRDDQADRRESTFSDAIAARARLTAEANQTYADTLKTELGNTEREMKNLADSLGKNSTAAAIRTVAEKIRELEQKALGLAGEIAAIDVGGSHGVYTSGGLPNASASDIQRQIIEKANEHGLPPEYALAIASFESNFNPEARPRQGKRLLSSARGIFQFLDGTFKEYGVPRSQQGDPGVQIDAGMRYMDNTRRQLAPIKGTSDLSFNDYYGAHLLGVGGYKKVLQNPNGRAVDVLGSEAVSRNNGNASQTAKEFVDMVTAKAAGHLQKVAGLVQRPMDAATTVLESETEKNTATTRSIVADVVKKQKEAIDHRQIVALTQQSEAIEAEIDADIAGARGSQSLSALTKLKASVRDRTEQIIENQLAQFDLENVGTDGYAENRKLYERELRADLEGKVSRLTSSVAKGINRNLSDAAQAVEKEIASLMTQSSKVSDPAALQSIIDQVREKWKTVVAKETEALTAKSGSADDFSEQLESLNTELAAGLNQKMIQLLDRYQNAIQNEGSDSLKIAQANLAAAQDPANSGKFTGFQIQELQNQVNLEQRAAETERLAKMEEFRTYILSELARAEAEYGVNSEEANALRMRQVEVERSLSDMRVNAVAYTDAAARSELGMADAIKQANIEFEKQNGLRGANGEMLSQAERFGEAWLQVKNSLAGAFSTLFTDLASGTQNAGEAFKKFGLTVINMLMEMIAKQMAFNIVQSLMGDGGSGGGGIIGSLLGAFTGSATGGMISGVKGAATGELITGGEPYRDSVLRKVMPGEMILRASAVNAIGEDSLKKVNALGNRTISAGLPALPSSEEGRGGDKIVNVWAVLPEEKNGMGPDDVVAVISDDIRRRGQTRSLIKAVNLGKM